MGGSTSGTARKGRGPVITACVTLVVCLVLTGGVLYVADRVSTALGEWEPPVGAPVEPSDGTIETPPHSELDGPPERAEVMGENEGTADERAAPEDDPTRPDGAWLEQVADDTGIPVSSATCSSQAPSGRVGSSSGAARSSAVPSFSPITSARSGGPSSSLCGGVSMVPSEGSTGAPTGGSHSPRAVETRSAT